MSTTDRVREHFEEEAGIFDETILKLVPYYREMIEAVIRALPFDPQAPFHAIDLGCGTGGIGLALKRVFPRARLVCLDLAANMIDAAREKLGAYTDVEFIIADFGGIDLGGPYDAVLSSLALHHLLTDADKAAFYRKIYAALSPGGAFYNADIVLGAGDHLKQMCLEQWFAFMAQTVGTEAVRTKWEPSYTAEDRPAPVPAHLQWLAEAGFADVDVIWKYYNFAVFGGRKPTASKESDVFLSLKRVNQRHGAILRKLGQ